jgi:Family of unknown function (DUF6399)
MPANQPTDAELPRQDPFRWGRADIAAALDNFSAPDHPSQRQFAEQLGIPHATFNYWTRRYGPDEDDPVDSFFRSAAGELLLRRILAAALLVFQQRGPCGLRLVGDFLQLTQLDRFVACSRGALAPLAAHLESDLVAFRDSEQPALTQQMKARTIIVVPDEHFHSGKPCLVAIEPVSNFILVECYRDRRDADTWKQAIVASTRGMPVEIIQLTSDLARALLCCAEKGFHAAHCPDLWHGQRDTLAPLLPLSRPVQQAHNDLEKATRHTNQVDKPQTEAVAKQEVVAVVEAVLAERDIGKRLQEAKDRQDQAAEQVRGVSDDYHPFDRQSGKPMSAEEVGKRLNEHIEQLSEVLAQAGLGDKAQETLNKARTWVTTLLGVVAWFWAVAKSAVEELELTEEQEQSVYEKLMPGHYWAMASGRARTAEERKRLKEMAEGLKKEAWQEGGSLSVLPAEARKEVERVAQHGAGLFQRSSSCVEGRNGRLSLPHHGHSRVSERRLKALTVLHNYMVKRPDGTTAAQRFFGQKHKEVFSWLLQRLPDLPRPAPKRRKTAEDGLPLAG